MSSFFLIKFKYSFNKSLLVSSFINKINKLIYCSRTFSSTSLSSSIFFILLFCSSIYFFTNFFLSKKLLLLTFFNSFLITSNSKYFFFLGKKIGSVDLKVLFFIDKRTGMSIIVSLIF